MANDYRQFDFDAWARLAEQDADGFERRRRAMISERLEALPFERRWRLQRLQWRVDQERDRCRTSLDACVRLYGMMWQSFAGDGGLVERLRWLPEPARQRRRSGATVVPLRRPTPRQRL